jgi:hypothetical protein
MWLIANNKNGVSSCELARALGVTQKTAWFMLHRIRLAYTKGSFEKLSGHVERELTDAQRFANALSQVVGKRVKYAELTGKDLVLG